MSSQLDYWQINPNKNFRTIFLFSTVKLLRNAIKKEFMNNSYGTSFDGSESWSVGDKFACWQ